jgi:hypothetical protein
MLASYIFGQRVVIEHESLGEKTAYEMVPYNKRYSNRKDDRIKTRQLQFPGRPPVVRSPIEARPHRTDPFGQTCVEQSRSEIRYINGS